MEKKYYTTETTSSKARKMDTLVEEGGEFDSDDESGDDGDTDSDENNNKKDYELVKFKKKKERDDRLDCESIISTYSNIYNRPEVITDAIEKKKKRQQQDEGTIQLSAKTGLPLGVLPEKPKSKNQMDKIEHKITRLLPEVPKRRDDETKEEKKARKQAVKEHRRERRVEKKINKLAFKEESKIQVGQLRNLQDAARTLKLPL
jgi:protein LTV1